MRVLFLWLLHGVAFLVIAGLAPYRLPENSSLVSGEYIVGLKAGHTLDAHWAYIGFNLSQSATTFRHFHVINAYHARIDEDMLHSFVRTDPNVRYVEHNVISNSTRHDNYNVTGTSTLPLYSDNATTGPQLRRKWAYSRDILYWPRLMVNAGDKIDLSGGGEYGVGEGQFFVDAGYGVNVYVLDSGVRISHEIFNQKDWKGRATDFEGPNSPYLHNDKSLYDYEGHGTSVASIVTQHANAAQIASVKIRGSNGETTAENAAAFNDVIAQHQRFQKIKACFFPGSVINYSGGAEWNQPFEDAIRAAYQAGIPVIAAAGNDAILPEDDPKTLCGYHPYVICVGASTRQYTYWEKSNWGSKVDIIAPGVNPPTAGWKNDDDYVTGWSGTSQACPVVSAIAAYFISYEGINNNVPLVQQRILANVLYNKISGVKTSQPNRLAMTGIGLPKDPRVPYVGAPLLR
ncbi:MAG: hypothetical protein Q9227_009412 [Pyrenula ochraceoflavens]